MTLVLAFLFLNNSSRKRHRFNYVFFQKPAAKVRNRFFLMLGLGLFSLFGSSRAVLGGSNLAGSGALGVLVLAFVAAQGWDSEEKVGELRVAHG